jgi:hypothetical protein
MRKPALVLTLCLAVVSCAALGASCGASEDLSEGDRYEEDDAYRGESAEEQTTDEQMRDVDEPINR